MKEEMRKRVNDKNVFGDQSETETQRQQPSQRNRGRNESDSAKDEMTRPKTTKEVKEDMSCCYQKSQNGAGSTRRRKSQSSRNHQ
jgi:hypothetical protein